MRCFVELGEWDDQNVHPFIQSRVDSTRQDNTSSRSDSILLPSTHPPATSIQYLQTPIPVTMKIVKSDFTNPAGPSHLRPDLGTEYVDHEPSDQEYAKQSDQGDDERAKISPLEEEEGKEEAVDKGKGPDEEKEEEGEDSDETVWPYFVETTLDKLDFEARKWLLFQLVCYEPVLLEEVRLGFPMSLVPNEPDDGGVEDEDFMDKRKGKEKEKEQVGEVDEKSRLMEVKLPKEEWLLTYCQIDSIPSSDRDEFLLNLFLMSPAHAQVLSTFHSSLEAGQDIQEV